MTERTMKMPKKIRNGVRNKYAISASRRLLGDQRQRPAKTPARFCGIVPVACAMGSFLTLGFAALHPRLSDKRCLVHTSHTLRRSPLDQQIQETLRSNSSSQ